jgi:hypothetical protein
VTTLDLTLHVENTYADGDVVITCPATTVPAPTPQDWDDNLTDWAAEHLEPLTGTGRTHGDSWYDVRVLACTDDRLVGRTFEFGY